MIGRLFYCFFEAISWCVHPEALPEKLEGKLKKKEGIMLTYTRLLDCRPPGPFDPSPSSGASEHPSINRDLSAWLVLMIGPGCLRLRSRLTMGRNYFNFTHNMP